MTSQHRSRPREVADAPARHRVLLREGVDGDGPVLEPGERRRADVPDVAVRQGRVRLVGDQQQVVADAELGDGVQEIPRVDGARRVRRAVDEDRARPRGDRGRHVLDVREVAALGIRGHEDRPSPRQRDRRVEVRVARVGHENLVARVDPDHERERQRLHGAHGHEHLRARVDPVPVDPLELLRDRLPELQVARVRRVLGEAVAERLAARLDDVRAASRSPAPPPRG